MSNRVLKGKKAIDELFAGEWEIVCSVLWDRDYEEMDLNTRRYFTRQIECAIWMLQNIEQARGGAPNKFWSEGGNDPKAFWAELESWRATPFVDPVAAKYDRMVKRNAAKFDKQKREREGA